MKERLFSYQKEGIEFLVNKKRAILGDDMGLGKTVQSIFAAQELNSECTLIVCPVSLISNWQNEINHWVGETVQLLTGSSSNIEEILFTEGLKKWNIISYEGLRQLLPLIKLGMDFSPSLIIADELHKIRNADTGAHRCIKYLSRTKPEMAIFGLSGTPLINYASDLFNLLSVLYPVFYTNKQRWIFENFNASLIRTATHSKLEIYSLKDPQLFKKKMSNYMLRRVKDDVLELPERTYNRINIELKGSQLDIYRSMEKDFISFMDSNDINSLEVMAPNVLSQIIRLKQICVSPDIIDPWSEDLDGAKIEKLNDILEELGDQKVVIFSQFAEVVKRLHNKLGKSRCSVIVGGQSSSERDYNINKFKNTNTNILLATIGSGGVGLNLTEASHVVFMDFAWAPAHNNQAIDRVHRIGQDKKVTVHILQVVNSIEEHIMSILAKKTALFEQTIPQKEMFSRLKEQLHAV